MAGTFDLLVLGAGSGGYACALRAAQLGSARGPGREGQGRRHLPAPRLHPDQGDPARRRGGRRGPGRGASSASTRRIDKIDLAGGHGVRRGRGRPALQGPVRTGRRARASGDRRVEGRLVRTDGRPAGVAVGDDDLHRAVRRAGHRLVRRAPCPGWTIDGEHILTSEHAWRLDRLPASAVVLGGGVIGCEFASAWRSFGVEVTIVEALPRLLAGEEPAVSAALRARVPQARDHRADRRAVESAAVEPRRRPAEAAPAAGRWSAELLLVAVGRGPVLRRPGVRGGRGRRWTAGS